MHTKCAESGASSCPPEPRDELSECTSQAHKSQKSNCAKVIPNRVPSGLSGTINIPIQEMGIAPVSITDDNMWVIKRTCGAIVHQHLPRHEL